MVATNNYRCQMCGNGSYETGETRAAGGFWSKIFDVQGKRFTTVTCTRCKHTDLYKAESNKLENIFDLFTNWFRTVGRVSRSGRGRPGLEGPTPDSRAACAAGVMVTSRSPVERS